MNDKIVDKIINCAYRDAGLFTKIQIFILTMKDREVKELYCKYRATASEVRKIKEDELPERCVEKINENAGLKPSKDTSFFTDIVILFTSKPMIASFAAFVLLGILITAIYIKRPEQQIEYSQEEILKAGNDAKLVFETINKAFEKTKNEIEEEIFKDKIAMPLNKSLNKISKIISKGDIK